MLSEGKKIILTYVCAGGRELAIVSTSGRLTARHQRAHLPGWNVMRRKKSGPGTEGGDGPMYDTAPAGPAAGPQAPSAARAGGATVVRRMAESGLLVAGAVTARAVAGRLPAALLLHRQTQYCSGWPGNDQPREPYNAI